MRNRGSADSGFTLLELLIVMVIIGAVVSLGVPLFSRSLDRAEVKTAAGTIASVMRLARGVAIATREPATAVVEPENRLAYVIRGKYDPLDKRRPLEPPRALPSSVKIWTLGEKTVAVEFSPSGAATPCNISLTQGRSHAGNDPAGYHLTVDALSGRAKVVPNSDFGKNEKRE